MHYSLLKLSEEINYYLFSFASKRNKEELLISYPDFIAQFEDLSKKGPKYINWLYDRFVMDPPRIPEIHPLEDSIGILLQYSKMESSLSDKYRSGGRFKFLVDRSFPDKRWNNPADITLLSIDDMEKIINLSRSKAAKVDIKPQNVEGDRVGKVGEWNLWLPTSRDNSIAIAKYSFNPELDSYEADTKWCTARINEGNVFYNYIGEPNRNFMLFYIIKDNPKKNNDGDYLAFAFEDCKPLFDNKMTVDRANKPLSQERLISILGGENTYYQVLDMLLNKCKSLGGVSPAMKKLEEASTNAEIFKTIIANNSLKEKSEFCKKILQFEDLSPEVLDVIAMDSHWKNRSDVAGRSSTSAQTLLRLSADENSAVRSAVAQNNNAPPEALLAIAKQIDYSGSDSFSDSWIAHRLLDRYNLPPEVCSLLLNFPDASVKAKLSSNDKTSPEDLHALLLSIEDMPPSENKKNIEHNLAYRRDLLPQTLDILANSDNPKVLELVAAKAATASTLERLSLEDKPIEIRRAVARNWRTTPSQLMKLFQSKDGSLLSYELAGNINSPPELLIELAKNPDKKIQHRISENESSPPEALAICSKSDDFNILFAICWNPNAPADVLSNIADRMGSANQDIKNALLNNVNTPPEIKDNLLKGNKISFINYKTNLFYKLAVKKWV